MAWVNAVPPLHRSRRRAITFVCALLFALAGGVIYVYARSPEYRAAARLKIAPAAMVSEASVQRRFTPAYLAFDPSAKSLQARLDALESQLKIQRAASARAALAEAEEEEEVGAAQTATEQLRRDVAENQKQAQEFAGHLNEYKALQQDLDHLEGMHRAALDRLAKLQVSEKQRAPRVDVLQAASPSVAPYWPDYNRDALIAVAGSVLFGLLAAWVVDFLSGPQTLPAVPT